MVRGSGRAAVAVLIAAAVSTAPSTHASRPPAMFVSRLAWAPGPRLALAAGRDFYADARLSVLRGRRLVAFGPASVHDVAWSPQGDVIAFAGVVGLAVIRPDGTGFRVLRRDATAMDSWSPDGRRILFDSGDGHLWVIGRDGRGARRLSLINSNDPSHAVWSPDGRRIAFQACAREPDVCDAQVLDLFVMSANGGARRRITRRPVADQCRLSWAPAREIAYETSEGPTAVATPDGTVRRTIRGFSCATWSPDGTRLLGWSAGRVPVIAHPLRGRPRPLLRFRDRAFVGAPPAPPVWSDDGREIAFTRVRGTFDDPVSRLYLLDLRTRRVRSAP
jgi:Tol biopolymer transport system component